MKYFTFARFVTLQALKKLRLAIVNAVDSVLNAGLRTADLAHGAPALSTEEMTDALLANI